MAESKLAVIMFSDIVGYTAIMEKDEKRALQNLKTNREIHIRFLQKYGGTLIKEIGDGLLMTFESVTAAIRCAKSIQEETLAENFSIRIGIHLGEIITENSDVLGDGVNLASRIEQAAEPGSIFISDSVFKSIQNKSDIRAISVGERKLKNIKEVVQLYRVQLDNESPNSPIPNKLPRISWVKAGLAVIIIAFLILTWTGSIFPWGDQESSNDQNLNGIAIFPFTIQGSESIQYLRNGMVDLISSKLDNIPQMNTVDPNILLSSVGGRDLNTRNPIQVSKAAREFGAEKFILGSITEVSDQLEIKLSKYDSKGTLIGNTITETGDLNRLYANIDNLIRRLVSDELDSTGSELNSDAILSISEVAAIAPFLRGEQLSREGRYVEAVEAYQEAVGIDSTFVLANYRMYQAMEWSPSQFDYLEVRVPLYHKLKNSISEMKGKNRELLEAYLMLAESSSGSIERHRELIDKYGPSKELLIGLGEALYHFNYILGGLKEESLPVFEQALQYDSVNARITMHLMDMYFDASEKEKLQNLVINQSPNSQNYVNHQLQVLVLQDSVSENQLLEIVNDPQFKPPSVHSVSGIHRLEWYQLLRRLSQYVPSMEKDLDNLDVREEKTQGIHLKYIDEMIANPGIDFGPTALSIFARSHPIHELKKRDILEVARSTNISEVLRLPEDIFDNLVVGVYEHSNGNEDRFLDRINRLKKQTEGEYGTFARLIYYQLEGMTAYNEGDFEKTLAYFDSAIYTTPEIEFEGPYQGFIHLNNLIKGEILFKLERFQDAEPYFMMNYRNPDMAFDYQDWNYGLCILRLGQIHQALDEEDEAIAYYNLLLDLYKKSDPIYSPWKDEAENQLQTLGIDLENKLQQSDQNL